MEYDYQYFSLFMALYFLLIKLKNKLYGVTEIESL